MALGAGAQATQDNEVAIGTDQNTYTLAGIDSTESTNRQSGDVYIVTTDAEGHLAATDFVVPIIPADTAFCTEPARLVPMRHRRGCERHGFDGDRAECQGHRRQRHGLR